MVLLLDPVHDDTEQQVLKEREMTQDILKKDIETIKEWFKSQPHLPKVLDDDKIKRFLILGKGRVELTKSRIDCYFSIRSWHRDIFDNSHPLSQRMIELQKHCDIIVLPKLNKDLTRAMLMKYRDTDPDLFHPYDVLAYTYNLGDMRLEEEICTRIHVIYDVKHLKMGHMTKYTPPVLRKVFQINEKVFSNSVAGIHIINAPSYIDNIIRIFKPFLKQKLLDRVKVHPSVENLYEFIDKDVLPKEYGGSYKTLNEIIDHTNKAFESYKEYFDAREKWEIKEELRPEKIENDDFYGYQGNFKQLSFD